MVESMAISWFRHLASFTEFNLTYHALEANTVTVFPHYNVEIQKENRANDLSHVTELINGSAASELLFLTPRSL